MVNVPGIEFEITGDLTGVITGDPPNQASGKLDAVATFPDGQVIPNTTWELTAEDPTFGSATVLPDGSWTYDVDPTWYDTLDDGQIETITFEATVTAVDGIFFNTATQDVTITVTGVCFTTGTLIKTDIGLRLIEDLKVGDLVQTLDNGLQQIRWIESSKMEAQRLRDQPAIRPVRISAGSLGSGTPTRDLLVSQQHRILIRGPKIEVLFGTPEALVAAKHLCSWPGIDVVETNEPVEYIHILLDRHEILMAEGALAESLFLGDEALYVMSSEGLQELAEVFPDTVHLDQQGFGRAARMILREFEARALV
ncbi:Hint domain-containing protein [Ruegeria arenilitoris]|uniref:Hint domain-containing protein n=1 Tax=Ruegeria arenilitoris TaxID=1173585 RepID=UPI00148065EB|nr:Hint domain-containing protein [Ruegeria arenilitoris]